LLLKAEVEGDSIIDIHRSLTVGMRIVNNSDPIYPTIQIVDLSGYKYPHTNYYH